MKKSKIIRLIVIISLFLCCFMLYREHDLRPRDNLTRAVRKEMKKDLRYLLRDETSADGIVYKYEIKNKDAETISGFVKAINGSLYDEQGKISVYVFSEIPYGLESVFSLKNYSDRRLETADYDGLCSLYISNPNVSEDPFFLNPSTYTSIKGIKKLEINQQMQKRAEEEGIDWYAYWPDLEEIIVREGSITE